ncbi:AraC family transcriptional regulator [Paenibacillus sp.]|uniref:helix-turn-helix transcriptional regulator n=1 Tax=Paenibacillus sp. TaxID=58172 RepID=UPI002D46C68A|nr:AraC family transcriptional regulator [Paenibacillus sp.]HZG57028.1 AraC family transcriptional regulator [Paenibacillus sp.]
MKKIVTNAGVLQIFFALLLVITVMFVSNYFVYKNSISGIYEKVTQNNSLVVRSIIQSFDSSFRTVNNVIHSIHGLPYDDGPQADGRLKMSEVYLLQEHLASLASSADFIEDIIVFYDNSSLAVTARGTSDFRTLFSHKYRHEVYNAEYWRSFSTTKHSFKAFPAVDYRVLSDGSQSKTKRLMALVGGNKIRLSAKNVIVLINVDALMKHVDQKAMLPGASLIVMDQDRNILLSTDDSFGLMEILNDVYFNATNQTSLTRENFEYNFYRSDYNAFVYIDKVPYQFQNIDSVNRANRVIMLTAILCAVLLSILLSIYLHKPVKRILRLFGEGHVKGNDFRKIHSGILRIQAENESYRKQLELVDDEMRRVVFFQSLEPFPPTDEQDALLRRHYPDFFRRRWFVMLAIEAKPTERDRFTASEIVSFESRLRSALSNDRMQADVFHQGNLRFLAMIGIEQSSGRETLVRRLANQIARFEKELSECKLQGVVSRTYESQVSNCPAAYAEVTQALPLRKLRDAALLDAASIRYEWNAYVPYERVEKLSNLLLNGRRNEAIETIRETLRENEARNVHRNQLRHVSAAMFYSMLQVAESGGNDPQALYKFELEFQRTLDEADGIEAVESALERLASEIASRSSNETRSKLNPSFISQYIDLHYMENLYLDHMAEVLETTPKYFSNYFKKTFGVNYVEYLNKVRLSHAKELLKDSGLTVAEIGERTGYLNSSTFTTTFKKYYGISPSEYRKRQVS